MPWEAEGPSSGCPKVARFAAFDHQAALFGLEHEVQPSTLASMLKMAILGGLKLATTALSEGDTGLRAALHTPEEPPSHRACSQRLWFPL